MPYSDQLAMTIDDELKKLVSEYKTVIKVVGTGGAGNNTISRLLDMDSDGYKTIAINTDAQDLYYTRAHKKILIGKELTRGLGAGSKPEIGEKAARENEQDIKDSLLNTDLVFITAGMGGGTGSGSAHIIAEIAKRLKSLVIGVVTLPFEMEGQKRMENAMYGIKKLSEHVDTLIVIPNDKLLELAPEVPISTAFKIADEILASSVQSISELVTNPGLVNLDFADLKAIMSNSGGYAMIGVGESDSDNRAEIAVEKAINNPLIDTDIKGASGALINIFAGPDFTLDEATRIMGYIQRQLDPHARIVWGASISQEMQSSIRVMIVVTGVTPTALLNKDTGKTKHNNAINLDYHKELGIELINPRSSDNVSGA